MCLSCRVGRADVSFEEAGFDELQQSFDHSRVEHALALSLGSTSYNRRLKNTMTTSTNNGDDEGRVRFEKRFGRSGIFVEHQALGVGRCMADSNIEVFFMF